jgi:hypothetical protein
MDDYPAAQDDLLAQQVRSDLLEGMSPRWKRTWCSSKVRFEKCQSRALELFPSLSTYLSEA